MQLRFSFYHAAVLPLAGLVLLASLGFVRYTTEVQTLELQFRLNALAVRERTVDAADLLLRLEAEQRQNVLSKSRRALPHEELENLAAFKEQVQPEFTADQASLPERLVRRSITWLQRVAGIDPPSYVYSANGVDLLTLAYNLERRRYFAEALVTFKKVIGREQGALVEDFARMHAGYCLFFLGEYRLARSEWATTKQSELPHNRQLAGRLLQWLDRFEAGLSKAAALKSARRRAESLYSILAYKESLEALLEITEHEREPAYYYLRGRVQEAPGNYQAAADDYANTLARDKTGDVAALANRRLLLMGTFYRNDTRLADAASKRAAALGDTDFLTTLSRFRQPAMGPEDRLTRETVYDQLLATSHPAPVAAFVRFVRVKTHDGGIITGKLVAADSKHVVLVNDSGRFRIPRADIAAQENVSGK